MADSVLKKKEKEKENTKKGTAKKEKEKEKKENTHKKNDDGAEAKLKAEGWAHEACSYPPYLLLRKTSCPYS